MTTVAEYSTMKETEIPWIGRIPSHWGVRRNKTVFSCEKSIVGARSADTQLLSLTTSGIKKKSTDDVGGKIPESYDTYQFVHENNIVMCLFDLDCSAVFSGLSKYKGMISPAYKVLRCNDDILPGFADYWFRSVFVGRKFKYLSKNIRYSLTYEDFSALTLPYPPLSEQSIIVKYLDSECAKVNEVISEAKASIEDYKQWKASVIYEAVTRGLRTDVVMKDSTSEWIDRIPHHVKISRVGLHYEIILGKMLCSEQVNSEYTLEPYYCAANVHFDGIMNDNLKQMWFSPEEKKKYLVKKGDLLVVEGGAGAGGCAISNFDAEGVYVQNSIMIVRPKQDANNRYLKYLLESYVHRGYIDFVCNKATIPHFTKEKLGNAPFPVFTSAEQNDIANFLDTKCSKIDELIGVKRALIADLEEYKKSLIYEVVTGKRRAC